MTKLETKPVVGQELDTGLGNLRARGTDLAALGLTDANTARLTQFPVLTDGVTPVRLSLVNSAPGAHADDGVVDTASRLGSLQFRGGASTQSHSITPGDFEVDLHVAANGPRANVPLVKDGKVTGNFIAYKENVPHQQN